MSDCFFLLCYLSCYIFSCSFLLTSFELFNFSSLYLFLSSLFFHPYVIFLFVSHLLLMTSLFILMTNVLSLFSFFLFMHQNSILDFWFFLHSCLPLLSNSEFVFFLLHSFYIFCLHFLHLYDSILLLKSRNLSSSSSRFLDLLPGFHFFLFQKSDTIGE